MRVRATTTALHEREPSAILLHARARPEPPNRLRPQAAGNMTVAEAMLWRSLRGSSLDGLKFRRQVPIGRYVVDFLCVEHRFIVELDGAPHDDENQKRHDASRDEWLREQGYRILRFQNEIVIGGGNIVLDRFREAIRTDSTKP